MTYHKKYKKILLLGLLPMTLSLTAQEISADRLAGAASLKIESGGSIRILPGSSLRVAGDLLNLGTGTNFIVESDANLVQVNDAALNTGNINVKRNIKLTAGRKQYNYLGTPVNFEAGQSYKTIYPNSSYVLQYNQKTNLFTNHSGVNEPGKGLALKEPAVILGEDPTMTTAIYKGVPQNGQIQIAVANFDPATPDTYGFNLIGNPYPSNIDLRKLYDINGGKTDAPQVISPNISPTFYFWDNNNNQKYQQQGSSYDGSAYALFNVLTGPAGTGLGTSSDLNTKVPTKIVKVGQGFMMRSLVSTYNFTFNDSVRTSAATNVDFLGKGGSVENVDRYWLDLLGPSGIISNLAVVYYEGGNDELGLEDSKNMGGSDAFYSLVSNEDIAINGRGLFQSQDKIPLGTHHFTAGNYTISLANAEGIFTSGQTIYLKDKEHNIVTDLNQGPYTFTSGAGIYTGRFEIIYEPETILATDVTTKEELVVYKDSGNFVVKAQSKKITDLQVFDMNGRLLLKLQPNSAKAVVPTTALIKGVYVLKVNQGGVITSKKIIK